MPSRTWRWQAILITIAGALAFAAAIVQGCDPNAPPKAPSEAPEGSTHTLDLSQRTLVQRIGPELADPGDQKFVQVEVTAVLNPRKIPVTFEVHYEPEGGKKVLLGSFGLYPPDHPGKFIVAAGGRLRRGGAIVLSMVVLDETRPDDRLSVKVKRISFRKR